ncbi:hypothetical protein BGZ57DRAFT_892167 [Hyaloscypha finlandica]|nr:hypothetical protein BGZ57DRAFT_892167 [Hyaloscypha finlandica]
MEIAHYTTWQITFDRIQQQNPASASLLKLWAYFNQHSTGYMVRTPPIYKLPRRSMDTRAHKRRTKL